jgi:predicted permease
MNAGSPGRPRSGVRRWRGWILRTDEHVRRQIDDELQAHIDARVEHLVERGMPPAAARAEAIRRFGDLEAARASLHARALAHQHRLGLAERVGGAGRDVRYAARTLFRSPAFTAGVVATLALGLGINSAVFRVADQALFRPPAGVRDPRAVRRIETLVSIARSAPLRATLFSFPDARLIQDSGAFESTAVQSAARVVRTRDGRDVAVSSVDDRFFPLLGVRFHAGRTFDALEGRPGSGLAVAVASFDYWTRHLGSAPPDGPISLTLGERTYRVVGVLPRGFSGLDLDPVDVWLPLGIAELGRGTVNGVVIPWYQSDMLRGLRVIGRPSPGTGDAALTERLTAVLSRVDAGNGRPLRMAALRSIVPVGDSARMEESNRLLGRLTVVAAFVLLIACANAVNLLLARTLRRTQELALRMAVGASRARLFRLLLVESVLLAFFGSAAAALGGQWTGDALRRLLFPDGRWGSPLFDGRTLLFTGVLAVLTGLAAGVAPAIQSTSPDLLSALKDGRGRGGAKLRATRSILVVAQTALSLVLLIAAGLLVLSLVRLNAVPMGFEPDGLVTAAVDSARAEPGMTASELASRLPADESIEGIALASVAPFGAMATRDVSVPGSTFVPESVLDQPWVMAVSPNYFSVLGTRIVHGRGLNADDIRGGEVVAVVNESMARRYWGSVIPSGGCVRVAPWPCARVVGVVQDVRDAPAGAPPPMRFYLPLDQYDRPAGALVVRTTSAKAPAVVAGLRAAIPPGQRLTVEIVADRVSRATRPWRTAMLLFLALGAVALALACVGVYSVMNYLVSERLHELGVRIVLGATRRDVLHLVLGNGLRLTVLGGTLGLMCAAATGRVLGTLLFDVSPFNPAIYGLAFACLAAAALTAMLPPALRASRLDPVSALRSE